MARHVGNGVYVCADGIAREYIPDPADWCRGCHEEVATSEGLCDFCLEEQSEAERRAANEAKRQRIEASRERLRAWVNADPARRQAAADCQQRLQELRRVG
jgi:hypothetical protein